MAFLLLSHQTAKVLVAITIDSVIRGYHVYKDVWVSYIGEVL